MIWIFNECLKTNKKISWEWFQLIFHDNLDKSENQHLTLSFYYEIACQQLHQFITEFAAYLNLMKDDLKYDDW